MPRPVLVVDFDLTLADASGRVSDPTKRALQRWREAGGLVVINTGRPQQYIVGSASPFPEYTELVDAVVFECGSGVLDVHAGRVSLFGEPMPDELAELAAGAVPGTGHAQRTLFARTHDPAGPADDINVVTLRTTVDAYNETHGTHFRVSHNVRYIDVIPQWVDKLVGLTAALAAMRDQGLDPGLLVGCGDAPLDSPFLAGCDVSVSVDGGERLGGTTDFTARRIAGDGVADVIDAALGHTATVAEVQAALAETMIGASAFGGASRVRAAAAPLLRARAEASLRRLTELGVEVREQSTLRRWMHRPGAAL
jgi:hydroxymethylpyrimidine pyrophosphatase-like HAD family hydrolase